MRVVIKSLGVLLGTIVTPALYWNAVRMEFARSYDCCLASGVHRLLATLWHAVASSEAVTRPEDKLRIHIAELLIALAAGCHPWVVPSLHARHGVCRVLVSNRQTEPRSTLQRK